MSLVTSAPESIQERLHPLEDGRFRFACHPDVPCFTECCRDLRLLLTPYDILRLKNHLELTAREFLDGYTSSDFDEQRRLPMVFLQMGDDERKTCPFVTSEGCQVYEDRPSACRIYPIARASRMHRTHGTVQESYFVLRESHCRGFEEDRHWTVEEWTGDQGLDDYHTMNNRWMEIITHPKVVNGPPPSTRQQQMFFMASYNLDAFRDFVLGSRFLTLFEMGEEEKEALSSSEEALLLLAFRWLAFSLCGQPTLTMKGHSAGRGPGGKNP